MLQIRRISDSMRYPAVIAQSDCLAEVEWAKVQHTVQGSSIPMPSVGKACTGKIGAWIRAWLGPNFSAYLRLSSGSTQEDKPGCR
jgi:hypothetical protein